MTNSSDALLINSSGNVGIGTTSLSSSKLTVQGDIRVRDSIASLFLQDTDGTNQVSEVKQSAGITTISSRNNTSNGTILFTGYNGSATTEYARITSGGAFLIGTTSNIDHAHSHIDVISTINGDINVEGIVVKDNTGKEPQSGSSYTDVLWNDGGDLYWEGDVISSGGSSDIRLKENIEPITDAIAKVKQLNGCTFNFKKESRN